MMNEEEQEKNIENEQATAKTAADQTIENSECCDNNQMALLLAEKEKQLEEQIDRYKRLQADFDNFRKRTRSEKEEIANVVVQNLICEMLPALDNFERAMASAATQESASILAGVEMIYRQLYATLEKNGLESINCIDCEFDPKQHEAVMRVQDDTKADGAIVDELQKGYIVKGRVIRPSMVKVVSN